MLTLLFYIILYLTWRVINTQTYQHDTRFYFAMSGVFIDDEADETSDEEFEVPKKKHIVSDPENSGSDDDAEDEEG